MKLMLEILQEGGPLPVPKRELLFSHSLGNELSKETHVLTKQETLLGRSNPGELLCLVASSLEFHGDGISFQVVFGQSF